MEDIRKFIIQSGGYLHHIGILTDDTKKMLAKLKQIPGLGIWSSGEGCWKNEDMVVGNGNTIICSSAKILDSILIEVIEPVKGKCENTHFKEYVEKKGSGFHHICYGIPHYEDFWKIYEYLLSQNCSVVIHGRKKEKSGKVTDEYCYFEIAENQIYLELCYTRYKWGY